jgi:hypothetical protein
MTFGLAFARLIGFLVTVGVIVEKQRGKSLVG